MGGQSHSTLKINNGIAVWDGETKIVPKLHAPGFCNVKSTSGGGVLRIANDASPFTHMLLRVRSTMQYAGFKVSFAADTWNPTFKSFKSDFTVQRNDGVWHTVAVPFENFSNDWSQYTGRCDTTDPNGKKHKCCSAEHPEVCPTKSNLKHISQLGIWAEGVAGKFHLEVKWIRAGTVFDKSIVEVAVGTKDLSTLVTALTAGKLVTALEGEGPFTVFAPTNEAFAKLPKATLHSLLEPKNIKQLDAVLEYHVVAGAAVYSKDLKASQQVKTLEGQQILVTKGWNGVHINGKAKVTTADVGATNGVVHIIDTVLDPSPTGCTGASMRRLTADQCAAWGKFWDGAGGPNWGGKGQNCSRSDPCACRHGVECSGGSITTISLFSSGLRGTISNAVGAFVDMTSFDVSGHRSLTGSLPASMSAWKKLTFFSVRGCGFNTALPVLNYRAMRQCDICSVGGGTQRC